MSGIRQSESTSDLMLAVSKGEIPNTTHVSTFGRNIDFNSSPEDVWDGGGIWVPPTQARIHNIFSTSTDDSLAGGGAQVVRVFGLVDWDTLETHEDIEMAGFDTSQTTNSYVIIHRMVVIRSGATSINVGTIKAEPEIDPSITAQIQPLAGETQMAIYGIPSIQDAYGTRFYTSVNNKSSASVELSILYIQGGDTPAVPHPTVKGTAAVNSEGSNFIELHPRPYDKFPGPCIIKVECESSTVNTDVSAGFDLILCRNQ